MIDGSYSRKYWVIFHKSNSKHWIYKYLDSFFQHVLVVSKSEGGYFWIELNPRGGNIHTNIYPANKPIRYYYNDSVIIETWSKAYNHPQFRFWHINCVEIVKKVLGIKDLFVLTPYQLYKKITGGKNGRHTITKSKKR